MIGRGRGSFKVRVVESGRGLAVVFRTVSREWEEEEEEREREEKREDEWMDEKRRKEKAKKKEKERKTKERTNEIKQPLANACLFRSSGWRLNND